MIVSCGWFLLSVLLCLQNPSLQCHPRLTHSWCWRCWWCTWWWCWCSRGCLLSAALCLALLPLPPTSECCCWFKFRAGGRTLPLSHSLISSKSHCTALHCAALILHYHVKHIIYIVHQILCKNARLNYQYLLIFSFLLNKNVKEQETHLLLLQR